MRYISIINEFEFLTSRQIFQLLELTDIKIKDQDKLNHKLDQMIKCKILTRYYFNTSEGKGIFRVYCMEKMAKYLLKSREIDCKWQPSDNAKPVEMIKQKLSGNQLLIAYMRKVKAFNGYQLKPEILAKTLSKKFKPTLRINFNYNDTPISFIYESIRRADNWKNNLNARMNLWMDFYKNYIPGDSGFDTIPQLVIIGEDELHIGEIFESLLSNNITLEKIRLYFTTDLEQTKDNLANSLYSVGIENDQFRINRINAQILG